MSAVSISQAPRIAGPPLIGASTTIARDPYGVWARWYRQHGPVFRLELPDQWRHWTVLFGRDANRLLATRGRQLFDVPRTYPRAEKIIGTNLHPSLTEGDLQRHMRRQVAPGFSRMALAPHLPDIVRWTREYVERWDAGTRVNVATETGRLGLNAISMFACGSPIGDDTDAMRRFATVYTAVIALGLPMATMKAPPIARTQAALDGFIEERLAHHRAHPPGRDRAADYFDFVLRGSLPDGAPLPERVRVVLGQLPFKNMAVYAGRVINQMLYQVVKRPEVLARVQPEVDRVFGQEHVDLDALWSMGDTRAALKETLRVLPVAVTMQRTVAETFDWEGYRIEEGSHVMLPIGGTHFLPEYFPEPARFDIDRFLPGRMEHAQRHVFNPFGLGHHACVAGGLFEALTLVAVGVVLHRWSLRADYTLRTIVDALPGPWPMHEMDVVAARAPRRTAAGEAAPPPVPIGDVAGEVRPFAAGADLFVEGDPSDGVFVVETGEIDVRVGGRAVRRLGPGSVVGEIGLLHGLRRSATVRAATPVTALFLPAEAVQAAVARDDVTASELAAMALRRRATDALVGRFGSGDLDGVGAVTARRFGPGEVVITQGEPARAFFLLLAGSVEVAATPPGRPPIPLRTLTAPDGFGEVGLLDGGVRTATVTAGTAGAELAEVGLAGFAALVRDPALRRGLVAVAAARRARSGEVEDAPAGR